MTVLRVGGFVMWSVGLASAMSCKIKLLRRWRDDLGQHVPYGSRAHDKSGECFKHAGAQLRSLVVCHAEDGKTEALFFVRCAHACPACKAEVSTRSNETGTLMLYGAAVWPF